MTVQASHSFVDGASILGAQLATCDHCKTLRVTDPARHAQPRYLTRTADLAKRDTEECPACISPDEAEAAAKKRVDGMNRERAREQAVRIAARDAPVVVPEPEPEAPRMLPNFPWYADMGPR